MPYHLCGWTKRNKPRVLNGWAVKRYSAPILSYPAEKLAEPRFITFFSGGSQMHVETNSHTCIRRICRQADTQERALCRLICYFLKIFHWLIKQRVDKLGGLSISSVTFWSAGSSLRTMAATWKGFSIMSWGREPKLFAFHEWVPRVSAEFLTEMWLQAENVGLLNKTAYDINQNQL